MRCLGTLVARVAQVDRRDERTGSSGTGARAGRDAKGSGGEGRSRDLERSPTEKRSGAKKKVSPGHGERGSASSYYLSSQTLAGTPTLVLAVHVLPTWLLNFG